MSHPCRVYSARSLCFAARYSLGRLWRLPSGTASQRLSEQLL